MQHARRWAAAFVLVAAGIVVACGAGSLKESGEECFASSECAAGLVCDFNREPAVCASMGSPPMPDAPVIPDDAPLDDSQPPPIDAPPDAPIDAAVDAL